MNAPAAVRVDLSDAQMRALAYFAVGVCSEGSDAGRDVSNRLSFAGTVRNGVMVPVGNSGFTIGTLQVDLGQRPDAARALTDAYQAWAIRQHPDWRLNDAQYAQTVRDLSRDGRAITAEHGRPMDAVVKQRLDQFLQSDDGVRFVHERDIAQVDHLMGGIVRSVRQTPLYRQSNLDERADLAAMMIKLQNQSENRWTTRLVQNMSNGQLGSVADVSRAIDGLRAQSGNDDYIESGRDHAVSGAHVFTALRKMEPTNPMHQAWQSVLADPLADPTHLNADRARPNLAAEYATVKTLFLQHAQAPGFIEALERGTGHVYGRPRQEGQGAPTAGLYSSGDDFLVWTRDGAGHARMNDRWSPIDRDDLSRVRNRDGSVDLYIDRNGTTAPLMHADPRAAPLRPVPQGRRTEAEPIDQGSPAGVRLADRETAAEHPLLTQARAAVRRLDASLGRTWDPASECMSASLACLARQNGLTGIDHVVLSGQGRESRPGENVYVVQGRLDNPAHLHAQMRTDVAVQTPMQDSMQRLQELDRQMAAEQALQPALQLEVQRRSMG
ncbi:hypothetical protein ASD78_08275 [Lysobacter sp. Root667]|nr:hypothetical protein ASD78_08275 [Lysobacter sp. Root667]